MSNVVSLAEHRPHNTGPALCMECRHRWTAVAPIGTTRLECPSCGTAKGVFVHDCLPEDGEVWTCRCGNELMLMLRDGVMCARCGLRQQGWGLRPQGSNSVPHPPAHEHLAPARPSKPLRRSPSTSRSASSSPATTATGVSSPGPAT